MYLSNKQKELLEEWLDIVGFLNDKETWIVQCVVEDGHYTRSTAEHLNEIRNRWVRYLGRLEIDGIVKLR